MKVFILQGLPGSGKSTFALERGHDAIGGDRDTSVEMVSADDFFLVNGKGYVFDPKKLPEAHAECLRDYTRLVRSGDQYESDEGVTCGLFVDNTNTSVAEVAPYYALAQAYGWDVEILHFPCDPETAAQRNTHGVSLDTCKAMAARLEKFEEQMPSWWVRRTVTE